MHIADLGELSGPVLIFGGPYSNLQATRALVDLARARGIGPAGMICTGDVIAYCADPGPTLDLVLSLGGPVLKGNCEAELAAGGADCGCGFDPGSTCSLLARAWYAHADAALGAQARRTLGGLPDRIVFRHAGRRYAVIHGGAGAINRFLWASSPEADFRSEIALLRDQVGAVDVVLAGHCGMPFIRDLDNVRWVNAGAIGLPPHDGGALTRFAMLDASGAMRIERLDYDAGQAAARMAQEGLVQGYHETLLTGVWPSEDVLPPELRRVA